MAPAQRPPAAGTPTAADGGRRAAPAARSAGLCSHEEGKGGGTGREYVLYGKNQSRSRRTAQRLKRLLWRPHPRAQLTGVTQKLQCRERAWGRKGGALAILGKRRSRHLEAQAKAGSRFLFLEQTARRAARPHRHRSSRASARDFEEWVAWRDQMAGSSGREHRRAEFAAERLAERRREPRLLPWRTVRLEARAAGAHRLQRYTRDMCKLDCQAWGCGGSLRKRGALLGSGTGVPEGGGGSSGHGTLQLLRPHGRDQGGHGLHLCTRWACIGNVRLEGLAARQQHQQQARRARAAKSSIPSYPAPP